MDTKLKKNHKFDEATLTKAKSMYMAFATISDISNATAMPRSSILYYAPKWRDERDRHKNEIIEALTESKRNLMYSIAKAGLEVLNRSMAELSKSKRMLTPREMSGVAAIVDNLDKIAKLDEGKPTEILTEIKPANIVEMRALLNNDPFLQLEEPEYVEISSVPSDAAEPELPSQDDTVKPE